MGILWENGLETKTTSRLPLLTWLVISQFLALVSFFATAIGAYAIIFSIISGVTAWIAYARKKVRLAVIFATLTVLPALVLSLVVILIGLFFPYGF